MNKGRLLGMLTVFFLHQFFLGDTWFGFTVTPTTRVTIFLAELVIGFLLLKLWDIFFKKGHSTIP